MSEAERTPGQIILGWWSRELGNRDSGAARGLAARLRRAGPIDALAECAVQDLASALAFRDGVRLSRLVRLLAEVREHSGTRLARRLGRPDPVLSSLRFQRLLRASDDELLDALRRAIVMADRKCSVAALGTDLLHWNDQTKTRWCFDYFGAEAPEATVASPPQTTLSETEA